MKKIHLIILALTILSFAFTSKNKQQFFPPGTVQIDSTLFFDKTEVSNGNWLNYTHWMLKKYGADSEQYKWSFPDSSVWQRNLSYSEPYKEYYNSHPAYKNYPVVGVTYEQVKGYCKWRTDRVREMLELRKLKKSNTYIPKKFICRLPTKKEWENQAQVGFLDKVIKKLNTKYKGKQIYNLKMSGGDNMGVAGSLNNNADITAPVISYWSNKNGIYNLIGNVAEMISERGVAKGGGWIHYKDELDIKKDYKYMDKESWLGFRCVFEIIEK